MYKRIAITAIVMVMLPCLVLSNNKTVNPVSEDITGNYIMVIEGYDWGPAVSKVILTMDETVSEASSGNYSVTVERSAEGIEMNPVEAAGERKVVYAYVSDKIGNRVAEGKHLALVLYVSPVDVLGSPIKYIRTNNRGSNQWIDYKMTITDIINNQVWNSETERILPDIDNFDLTGTFSQDGIALTYGSFSPESNGKSPLIIWLHGGGEGGTDPSIALIANKAWNYAATDIQSVFGGAYVLVPQSPTFWMQSANGEYTRGDTEDIYNTALMGLIKKYVADNPGIDQDRIYIGGCSNGGYMSLKLILRYPDYFAAGFISALAYQEKYITDKHVQGIKNVPIWFVHAKDDSTTIPEETVVPLYNRLIKAGANNIHFSFYDHVTDITGFFGGKDYRYNGHWSWIYSHADHANFDYDGTAVKIDGRPVTIMEWMAAQHN